jgi:hypothetical protein
VFGDWLHDAVRKMLQSNNLLLLLSAYRFASVNFYSLHRFIVGVWVRIKVRDRVRNRVRVNMWVRVRVWIRIRVWVSVKVKIKVHVSVRIRVFSIVVNSCWCIVCLGHHKLDQDSH